MEYHIDTQTEQVVHYSPQIDALRGVGALLVLADHWSDLLPMTIANFVATWAVGRIGIAIFFIISGFMITKLLLDLWSTKHGHALRSFWVQRAFRMLPAYYFVLVCTYLLFPVMRQIWPIHAFFVGNFYPFWSHTAISVGEHLWSVGAEIQFYFLWPLLLLNTRHNYLKHLCVVLFFLGPLSRYLLLVWAHGSHPILGVFTAITFDWLGFGALLAMAVRDGYFAPYSKSLKFLELLCFVSATFFIFCHMYFKRTLYFATFEFSLTSFIFAIFIVRAANKMNGKYEKIYFYRPVLWIGLTSYSIYLVHPFVPHFCNDFLLWRFNIKDSIFLLIINLLVLALFSTFLYRFIELPFRKWGKSLK